MNKFGTITLTALGTLGVVAGGTAIALNVPTVQEKIKEHFTEPVVEQPSEDIPVVEEPTININLGDYEFSLDEENKTATIVSYSGTDSAVLIPSTFSVDTDGAYVEGEDYTVTGIGEGAFKGNTYIESVVIPEGIVNIGNETFRNCYRLCSVSIPSTITTFGRNAFTSCYGLIDVELTEGISVLGENAFSGCGSLRNIEIPSSVTKIEQFAFSSCSSLSRVILSEGLVQINSYAFSNCTSLKSINLPNTLTTIEHNSFTRSGLESIELPNSVSTFGVNAFSYTNLESFTIPENVLSINNSILAGCENLKTVIIHSNNFYTCIYEGSTTCSNLLELDDSVQFKVLASIVDDEDNVNTYMNDSANFTRTLDDDGVYYTYTKVVS